MMHKTRVKLFAFTWVDEKALEQTNNASPPSSSPLQLACQKHTLKIAFVVYFDWLAVEVDIP